MENAEILIRAGLSPELVKHTHPLHESYYFFASFWLSTGKWDAFALFFCSVSFSLPLLFLDKFRTQNNFLLYGVGRFFTRSFIESFSLSSLLKIHSFCRFGADEILRFIWKSIESSKILPICMNYSQKNIYPATIEEARTRSVPNSEQIKSGVAILSMWMEKMLRRIRLLPAWVGRIFFLLIHTPKKYRLFCDCVSFATFC